MQVISKGFVPKTPRTALRGRCETSMRGLQPETLLFLTTLFRPTFTTTDGAPLDKIVAIYVCCGNEKWTRKMPICIYQILSGLLRSMQEINPGCPNFIDETHFRSFTRRLTLTSVEKGLGASVKSADRKMKRILFGAAGMGTKTPQALFNAVFYYNGVLKRRRRAQTRRLQLSQFEKKTDHFMYNENCSPRIGVAHSMHLANKVVPIYCTCTVEGENVETSRCHVHLFDMYRERLPEDAKAD